MSLRSSRVGHELVVLFQSRHKGVVLHERLTAYNFGEMIDFFDAESGDWEPFEGPIYFSK
jgi:hypothetical protein